MAIAPLGSSRLRRRAGQDRTGKHWARMDLTIDSETGPTQYRLSLEGADTQQVKQWAGRLTSQLATLRQLRNVSTDANATAPAIFIA